MNKAKSALWQKVDRAASDLSQERLELAIRENGGVDDVQALKALGKYHCQDRHGDHNFGLQVCPT